MLLVDERHGSEELLPALQRAGVPAELTYLDYGDFAFIGRGIDGADIFMAIELKRTRDLVTCVYSSRFSGHQLIGLQNFDRGWLLTEGIWRAGEEGVLEEYRWVSALRRMDWTPTTPRIMVADLESWILTQTIRGGLHHWHAPNRKDTVRFLSTLYKWWTSKDLDEHRSHAAIYLPPPDRAMLVEPSCFLKMASCLPAVGWDRAAKLDEACHGSMRALVGMTALDLRKVNGIGQKIATGIIGALDPPALV